jgi:hypothetical protein
MRTRTNFLWIVALTASVVGQSLRAQDGRQRVPSNATAKCEDGTYSTAKTKRGVCSAHGGVAQWLTPAKTSQRSSGGTSSAQVKRNGRVPSNATAKCSDGTYSTAKSQQGACSQHGGVAEWLGATEIAEQDVPEGATARCGDGTYSQTQGQGTCSSHGGVAEWLPADETVPANPTTNQSSRTQGDIPAEATARCKDGTYSRSTHRSGTCSYHGGVAEWLRRPPQD